MAGSEVGGVPGRPTVGEDGETGAGGKRYAKQVPIKNNSKLCLTIPTPFKYVVNTDMHTAMRQVNTCKKCHMYQCVLEWAGKWVWSE